MSEGVSPCLSLAISRLATVGPPHFAIWVTRAPHPSGYVHCDRPWPGLLTQLWLSWQELFALHPPHVPITPASLPLTPVPTLAGGAGYGGRLMQELGIALWEWLFDGPVGQSLAHSQGIALGQNQPLRLHLEIRDPGLIALPWEIMQPQPGKPAIALGEQVLFSRTTSDVDALKLLPLQSELQILLVLGEAAPHPGPGAKNLQLQQEADTLAAVIQQGSARALSHNIPRTTSIHTLVQPTAAELLDALTTGRYNLFFYAGHGVPAPDGGLLFLRSQVTLNGTELAQALVHSGVVLAAFNACWGAQPAQQNHQAIPRSSLTEVLIHHGVPSVLGMRDSIADEEALTFIAAFTKAISEQHSIDRAVAIARQELVTLYKFNQPAWTLPILYLHPDFDGKLLTAVTRGEELTAMPTSLTARKFPSAQLKSAQENQVWQIYGGLMRVGRHQDNDLVLAERWVSQRHAEILCRELPKDEGTQYCYFLRDFSRFGTLVRQAGQWQKVHHQEIGLAPGNQLKFGSAHGQTLEFSVES